VTVRTQAINEHHWRAAARSRERGLYISRYRARHDRAALRSRMVVTMSDPIIFAEPLEAMEEQARLAQILARYFLHGHAFAMA
jgi:hypothetical protein